jgi:heme/copper-type cytochrome/quinol oxidase subunit 3
MWDAPPDQAYLAEPPPEETRETLGTSVHDAYVERRLPMPAGSLAPIILAFGLLIIAFGVLPDLGVVKAAVVLTGLTVAAYGLLDWFWPRPVGEGAPADPAPTESLPWWGMSMVIVTEAVLFGSLLSAYLYIRSGADDWPLGGIEKPTLMLPLIGTVLLLGSSIPMAAGEKSIKSGGQTGLCLGLGIAFVMAAAFLAVQGYEYATEKFGVTENAYTSLFFVVTGIHGLHVLGGLAFNGWVQARAFAGHFTQHNHEAVRNVALYWHFVDVIWIFILATVYVSPHIL